MPFFAVFSGLGSGPQVMSTREASGQLGPTILGNTLERTSGLCVGPGVLEQKAQATLAGAWGRYGEWEGYWENSRIPFPG